MIKFKIQKAKKINFGGRSNKVAQYIYIYIYIYISLIMITSKQETREKIHGISLNQIFNFFQKIQRDDNTLIQIMIIT